ncbi:MAG: hypothetical protein VYC01_05455, partial [Nitrospinota bacterium]|nr:hypothetical protein [Nitrospinota bacterium]
MLKILFLAANWRVSLLKAFQDAKANSKTPVQLIALDSDSLAPALKIADQSHCLPLFSDSGCLESLITICRKQAINAIVPLTNNAIDFLDKYREELSDQNRRLFIPESFAIK